jgi:hypothetical protein
MLETIDVFSTVVADKLLALETDKPGSRSISPNCTAT